MKLEDLYHSMIEAANKAKEASDEYVARETKVKELVRESCRRKGITNPDSPGYRTVEDDYLDNDKLMKKAFGRWDFWQREQRRRSDLVRTHIAYCQFYGKLPYNMRPQSSLDAHDSGIPHQRQAERHSA